MFHEEITQPDPDLVVPPETGVTPASLEVTIPSALNQYQELDTPVISPIPDSIIIHEFGPQLEEVIQRIRLLQETTGRTSASFETFVAGEEHRPNAPTDSIKSIVQLVHSYLEKVSERLGIDQAKIASVLAEGYPYYWRQGFPDSEIISFDINPIQLLRFGEIGDNKRFAMDVTAGELFTQFLKAEQPDVLYLSNIHVFLEGDEASIQNMTQSLIDSSVRVVVLTVPSGDAFEQVRAQLNERFILVQFDQCCFFIRKPEAQ